MTASQLYQEYNKQPDHLGVSLQVVETFMNSLVTPGLSDEQLLKEFSVFVWRMFFD